jgi:UDP-N-acetylmuramate: L-alanyl-gamma-D-glutamyl-meso-diaminopimelate ligase
VTALGARATVVSDLNSMVADLSGSLREGDHVLIMSNGGFGGLHDRLLAALGAREH